MKRSLELNNQVISGGTVNPQADQDALLAYFREEVNPNTVFFHDLEEKIKYMVKEGIWDGEMLGRYTTEDIKAVFKAAYTHKFRFKSFMGASKFYGEYATRTPDRSRWLERFEDRMAITALARSAGDAEQALRLVNQLVAQTFTPATPTLMNSGKVNTGRLVSCFLLSDCTDNLNSIMQTQAFAAELSKGGGGVAITLDNLRARGEGLKNLENVAKGAVAVGKLYDVMFRYADQAGQRQGAGAVYLSVMHPDFRELLNSKKIAADEDARLKTLSIGAVVPDVFMQAIKDGTDIYQIFPHSFFKATGREFTSINWSAEYAALVANPDIRKQRVSARKLAEEIALTQGESGYPYLLFEGNANRANPVPNVGKVTMTNLCVTGDSEILTSKGYRTVSDLYATQEDFDVVVDTRARDMSLASEGVSIESSTRMFKTAEQADILKLTTAEGYELRATEWHKFYVVRDGELSKIPLSEVEVGDQVLVQSRMGAFAPTESDVAKPYLAYLAGGIAADGCIVEGETSSLARLYLYGDKEEFIAPYEKACAYVLEGRGDLLSRNATLLPKFTYNQQVDRWTISSAPLANILKQLGMTAATKTRIPEFVKRGSMAVQVAYLSGLFQLDASITGSRKIGTISIELSSVDRRHLVEVQRLLLNFGIYTRIYKGKAAGKAMLPDGRGGVKEYDQQAMFSLRTSVKQDRDALYDLVEWRKVHRDKWVEMNAASKGKKPYQTHRFRAMVIGVEPDGAEDVYDVTVENGHSVIFNGIATGNCTEILQPSIPSTFNGYGAQDDVVGLDISCNLSSLHIANTMDSGDIGAVVSVAVDLLDDVAKSTNITEVPAIAKANRQMRSIGLGAMGLHSYLARSEISYGSPEALEFCDAFFAAVHYHARQRSMEIARDTGFVFEGFQGSLYESGAYFEQYLNKDYFPRGEAVIRLFDGMELPSRQDWRQLVADIQKYGLAHSHVMAIAPTGSISYCSHASPSIAPINERVEVRTSGKGKTIYPMPYLSEATEWYYEEAFQMDQRRFIDTVAVIQRHVDQGISCTLCLPSSSTTADLTKLHLYAYRKGLKTLYYTRMRKEEDGETCVSCAV